MTRIVLDEDLKNKLRGLKERLEIIDEDLRVVGFVTPAVDRSLYEGVVPPFSKEELDLREQRAGGGTRRPRPSIIWKVWTRTDANSIANST